jgi:uncharacterized protein (TIGR02246 family)
MKQELLRVTLVAALGAAASVVAPAQQPPTAPAAVEAGTSSEPTSPDLDAIRAQAEKFVDAFNSHDAKALAALWTAEGEYIDNTGRTLIGRDAIEKDYAALFAENPDVKIKIAIDSLRLLSGGVAVEDGRAIVQPLPPGAPGVGRYRAIHAKADGKWLMASVRDAWNEAQVTRESVADLGWLIGTWSAEEHGVRYDSVARWVANGNFVEREYTTKQVDGTTASGVQLIGWNPLEGRVQSWSFSPDGGHDFGVWSLAHDGWRSEMRGVTGEGLVTSSVNLLKRLDDNAYVWQSVQRMLDGRALPDTDEVVIKRRTPAPATDGK